MLEPYICECHLPYQRSPDRSGETGTRLFEPLVSGSRGRESSN